MEDGCIDEEWWDEVFLLVEDVPKDKQVVWATLNLDVNISDPSTLSIELIHQGQTHMLANQPKSFMSGSAEWSRTSFDFAGHDPAGIWALRIKDQKIWGSSVILKWQLLLGVVDR